MTYKITKYGLLITLALLTLYQILPIGDYCSGIVQALLMFIFGGILILSFIIFTVIDASRLIRKKIKYDFIPLIIITLFFSVFFIFINSEIDKFWTKTTLTGQIDEGDLRAAQIQLYSNNTFAVRISYIDWSCTYQGDYKISNDTLFLMRDDLMKLTNNVFDSKYKFSYQDSLLIPVDRKCKMIKTKTGHNK
jgi:hypothetical protein